MQRVLIKLKCAWVDLRARKEIHRAFFILHFDVLVIANKIASLSQFKNVFHIANWTNYLTSGYVLDV